MKPRILLMGDDTQNMLVSTIERKGANFNFVDYVGSLDPLAIELFIKQNRSEFDAIAVHSHYRNAPETSVVENHFRGPKILLRTDHDHDIDEKGYVMDIVLPVKTSEFERQVEEVFGKHVTIVGMRNTGKPCKIVQLYADGEPYMAIQGGEKEHHQTLERFLEERGIGFNHTNFGRVESAIYPKPEGERYKVVGMGLINLYPKLMIYTGMGWKNKIYGLGIDKDHKQKTEETLRFLGFNVNGGQK